MMDLPSNVCFGQILLLWVIVIVSLTHQIAGKDESEGYYAFEEAKPYMRPPKVRKPPYVRANMPCPSGGGSPNWRPAPKFTLCGDLNKGYIPLNPLGQEFDGEPYPFDLIKNKTLKFFSKALPYLKKDPNLPKVAKYDTPSPPPLYNQKYTSHRKVPHAYQYRARREVASNNSSVPVTSATLPATEDLNTIVPEKSSRFINYFFNQFNESTARQSCDQGGAAGLLCTVQSVMSNSKVQMALLNTIANGLSAMGGSSSDSNNGNAIASSLSSLSSLLSSSSSSSNDDYSESGSGGSMATILSLLGSLANLGLAGSTKNDGHGYSNTENEQEPSSLAHVMSVLTGASPGNPSALSLVLKLLASEASPLKAIVGGFQKRRPPGADEPIAAESSVRRPQESDYELPPTPCASNEEYVTPTFARNYQGIWKYVVQIPQEGYFTQTVQQTKCLKNRCDFMDGVCHESPRWVSLLVAETYYPDTYFPTVAPTPDPQAPPPVDDFYNFQQYLKRRVGQSDAEATSSYRSHNFNKEKLNDHQQCDGHDHIGCYVVRLYYDWFLVNGSCKCWKPSPKRILTGK